MFVLVLYTEKRDNSTWWKFSRDVTLNMCLNKRDVPPKTGQLANMSSFNVKNPISFNTSYMIYTF